MIGNYHQFLQNHLIVLNSLLYELSLLLYIVIKNSKPMSFSNNKTSAQNWKLYFMKVVSACFLLISSDSCLDAKFDSFTPKE